MPDFTKIDPWSYAALFLPGLLLWLGYNFGLDSKVRRPAVADFAYFTALSLGYGIVLWLQGFALQTGQSIFALERNVFIKLYILTPIAIGLLFGFAARFDLIGRVLGPLGLARPEPPPIRTPWPVIAPKIAVGTYLMVILKDKTIYRALVTEDSALSSDQDKIDLYLGQTFEGEDWVPSAPQRAVYIRGSEIQSIEIWKLPEAAAKAAP